MDAAEQTVKRGKLSRRTVLWLVVVLDALVLGGCVTLLLVRSLLPVSYTHLTLPTN